MATKILEQCKVTPPEGSVPPSTLPLTFFDVIWYGFPISTQRVFLYEMSDVSTSTFLSSHLPNLKHSLSLALKPFYPLAGRLVKETAPPSPCIRYSDGDSVAFTVVISDDNLRELASDEAKDAVRLRPLVPSLPISETDQPVVSLQVTLFPDQGISIGITALHVAVDGSSSVHFMRTWASICKLGEDTNTAEVPPLLDRNIIPDPMGFVYTFPSMIEERKSSMTFASLDIRQLPNIVRATFRLSKVQLDELRRWVASKTGSNQRCSSFTLAVALVWTCLLKTTGVHPPKDIEHLAFVVDCRARLKPPIPTPYFGNCHCACFVEVERNRVVIGKEGVAAVAMAIMEGIRGLQVEGALQKKLSNMVDDCFRVFTLAPLLSVAGSPRISVYNVDFGWGRPSKCEVVSIEGSGAISLAENSRDDDGGLEIGLVLPGPAMEEFSKLFYDALSNVLD